MRWLDVAGAPGSGKSTLCDRKWPRKIPLDGEPLPTRWRAFIDYAYQVAALIPSPESASACREILGRYFEKMATVERSREPGVYVNTGFAQAGLEIGWRMDGYIAGYFHNMPASVGVAFLWADAETLRRRNRERGRDRSHLVEGMERTRLVAEAVLAARGVPVVSLDTRQPRAAVANALEVAARG